MAAITSQFVSVSQAAKVLKTSARYVRRLAEQGKLKATKIDGLFYMIDRADLKAFARRRNRP